MIWHLSTSKTSLTFTSLFAAFALHPVFCYNIHQFPLSRQPLTDIAPSRLLHQNYGINYRHQFATHNLSTNSRPLSRHICSCFLTTNDLVFHSRAIDICYYCSPYPALPAVVFYYWGQVAVAFVECDVLVTSPLQGF